MEAIGARPFRMKVKRRKASVMGESALSDEAQYPAGITGVLATGWERNLLSLPSEICWVPRMSGRPEE